MKCAARGLLEIHFIVTVIFCGIQIHLLTYLYLLTGRKNDAKIRHLRTIAQLCRAESSQLRHVSTIGKTRRLYEFAIRHVVNENCADQQ